MPDTTETPAPTAVPDLADMQHWTWVLGRAQQMMLEAGIDAASTLPKVATPALPPGLAAGFDPAQLMQASADFWTDTMQLWQRFLDPAQAQPFAETPEQARDKRFRAPEWREQPVFDFLRQSYLTIADHLLKTVDALDGLDPKQKEQVRFATRGFVDAMSPTNFAVTNPEVIRRAVETGGESLLKGLQNMLADIQRGQLTHTDAHAFEVGRNIATTPGKVVHRTALYELIHYAPTTERVLAVPLVIFPPWINRFYILDLTAEKSFIGWAVAQGLSVFVVSWKSADATLADVVWDDYIAAQVDAIDTVRDLLDVPAVHTIGYCVAGTTLAATLALLTARSEADKVASATFFTAQVDFSDAGELQNFIDDESLAAIKALATDGYLDGRYMALTFNLLRGRDLIWNYVSNNYLMGQDYVPFDLLHWNGDVTNLPAAWHQSYLTDLYRDNRLVVPGSLSVFGTPIDLTSVRTPSYVQAGREDHIAPAESVWKITDQFSGPLKFVLAGSGHIAGVVNPPSAQKYQYWTNGNPVTSLAEFVAGATETKGSWWPDWVGWLKDLDADTVKAKGARVPGKGRLAAIADAPGDYVRTR
ncbi:MAG: class I poly(R)-hydroxyalkanoic acid synthase [Pseudomonadota bacterium]